MRHKIVAGNWKMNNELDEGMKLVSEVANMVNDEVSDDVKVIIAPPFVHLAGASKLIGESQRVGLAAQNCSEHLSGAYTGEVSAAMLSSVGAQYVIIGHSERREYFNESNEALAEKVKVTLDEGLIPIFCCGESLEIRENGLYKDHVTNQLKEGLFQLSEDKFSRVVIAYEPIWAIGTGKTASATQAQEMHAALREYISERYGEKVAMNTSILYGGSCKPGNAKEIFTGTDVDGGLIGGASLNARDFVDIAKAL